MLAQQLQLLFYIWNIWKDNYNYKKGTNINTFFPRYWHFVWHLGKSNYWLRHFWCEPCSFLLFYLLFYFIFNKSSTYVGPSGLCGDSGNLGRARWVCPFWRAASGCASPTINTRQRFNLRHFQLLRKPIFMLKTTATRINQPK